MKSIVYNADGLTYRVEETLSEEDLHSAERSVKLHKIQELKSLLSSTDYKAIKYAEGELSASEYEPIRLQRKAWREEINELEKQLGA